MRGKVTMLPPIASTLEGGALGEWSFGLTRGGGREGNTRMNSSNPPHRHKAICLWLSHAGEIAGSFAQWQQNFPHMWIEPNVSSLARESTFFEISLWQTDVSVFFVLSLSRFTQRNIVFPSSAEREHWDKCSDSCASVEIMSVEIICEKQAFINRFTWIFALHTHTHTHTQAMSRCKFREMGQFKVSARQPRHCSPDRLCLCVVKQQQESHKNNLIVYPTTAYLIQTVFTVRLRVNFHFHHHRIRTSNVAEHFGCVFF